jgi:hypothetical protein
MYHLKPFSYLLLIIVSFLSSSVVKAQSKNDCSSLDKISIVVVNADGNSATGKVVLRADGVNLSEFNCILYAPQKAGNRLNFRLVDGTIENLKAGQYILFVQDNSGDGCTKQFSFKIN